MIVRNLFTYLIDVRTGKFLNNFYIVKIPSVSYLKIAHRLVLRIIIFFIW